MKRLISLFAGLFVFLVLASIAMAQGSSAPAEDVNALTRVTDLVFQILMVVLPVVAMWLTHRGIAVFEKKTGIDVPDAIEAKIDEWAEQGFHLAAEKSYKKVKAKTAKLSGPEKLEEAADFVFALANARGYVDWSKDKIKAKVEALLGMHRSNGGVPKLDAPEDKPAE